MLRKQILKDLPGARATWPGAKAIPALAAVLVTSEAPDHPVDCLFDSKAGPGGTCWVAASEGEQTLILAFDTPQTIRDISLEVEEPETSRTQVLSVALPAPRPRGAARAPVLSPTLFRDRIVMIARGGSGTGSRNAGSGPVRR